MKLYRVIYLMEEEELGHGDWHSEEDTALNDAVKWMNPDDMLDTYDRGYYIEDIEL